MNKGKGCTTHFINFFMKWHFLYMQIPEMIISGMSCLYKKMLSFGESPYWSFYKNDLHEPCFLWNSFPELSLDMTCEANCTGAFYKHLSFSPPHLIDRFTYYDLTWSTLPRYVVSLKLPMPFYKHVGFIK